MAISRKWKLITGLNLLLLIVAMVFAFSQWSRYDHAVNYIGPEGFNESYWLHPDNKYVEEVQYVSKFSGYVDGLEIQPNGEILITLENRNTVIAHEINTNRRNYYYLYSEAGIDQVTDVKFFSNVVRESKISYRCEIENNAVIFCDYFRG